MKKITRDDIQKIFDKSTLMKFLKEKLNLPIPEGLTLNDITSNFSNFALGFSGYMADQVLDCQEISISSGQPSGIFIVRCKGDAAPALILRNVAESLGRWGRNPSDLSFFCVDRHFQPTAFAYLNDFEVEGEWHSIVLNIFQWTQDNTYINISAEHEIPVTLFHDLSTEKQEDTSENDCSKENVIEIGIEGQNLNDIGVRSISSENLLVKLHNIGTPLGQHWDIHTGITSGRVKAFVIDEHKRQELIKEHADSSMVITPIVRTLRKRKWKLESAYLIWISNSLKKQWPWSYAEEESEAEQIFAQTYPAIYQHLIGYKDILKSRGASSSGKFYWELYMREPKRENYPEFYQPKIIFPLNGNSMRAFYDTSEAYILGSSYCIPTEDLSLLAILNSTLFGWYARTKFKIYAERPNLFFTIENMVKVPIATQPEDKKIKLSLLVKQILDAPTNPNVFDFEEEINQLVYELYELTSAEIKLIEEETNK